MDIRKDLDSNKYFLNDWVKVCFFEYTVFFRLFVFNCTCSMQKFPGQGSNWHYRSNPSYSSDKAGSLTARPPGGPNTQCLCAEVSDCCRVVFLSLFLLLQVINLMLSLDRWEQQIECVHGRCSLEVCWLNEFVFWENLGHQFRIQIPWSCSKAPSIFDLVHWLVRFQNLSFDERWKKKKRCI